MADLEVRTKAPRRPWSHWRPYLMTDDSALAKMFRSADTTYVAVTLRYGVKHEWRRADAT